MCLQLEAVQPPQQHQLLLLPVLEGSLLGLGSVLLQALQQVSPLWVQGVQPTCLAAHLLPAAQAMEPTPSEIHRHLVIAPLVVLVELVPSSLAQHHHHLSLLLGP